MCKWIPCCYPVLMHGKSCVLPLQHTSLNLPEHVHHRPHFFQSLPKSEAGVNMKASCRKPSKQRSGIPWALVSRSWSWAACGGVASCPESTSRVCPAMAAPHCPPRRSLQRQMTLNHHNSLVGQRSSAEADPTPQPTTIKLQTLLKLSPAGHPHLRKQRFFSQIQ